MKQLLEQIDRRLKILENGILKAEADLRSFPEGRLRVSTGGGTRTFYLVAEKGDTEGKYLPRSEMELVKTLAQKQYNHAFLQKARAERARLMRCHRLVEKEDASLVFPQISQIRRDLVQPYVLTDELFVRRWQNQEFEPNPYKPEQKIYETNRGELVRSKSEKIIADMLFKEGVPYHYEKPLRLNARVVKYPDFTVLHAGTMREKYWEHCGLMDDDGYRKKAFDKLDEYRASGFYLGEDLFMTYEDKYHSLDITGIHKMITALFVKGTYDLECCMAEKQRAEALEKQRAAAAKVQIAE